MVLGLALEKVRMTEVKSAVMWLLPWVQAGVEAEGSGTRTRQRVGSPSLGEKLQE